MVTRALLRLADRWAGARLEAMAIDQRATLRFVTAAAIAGLTIAATLLPIRLLEGLPVAISLVMSGYWVLLLVLVRRSGGLAAATTMLVLAILVLGLMPSLVGGSLATLEYTPWLALVGLSPVLFAQRRVAAAILCAGAAAAVVALALKQGDAGPTLTRPTEVIPMFLSAWLALALSQAIHDRVSGEVRDQLEAAEHQRAALDARTDQIHARAAETLQFLTTMSHELRTPLNGVLGLADLLAHEGVLADARWRLDRLRGTGRAVLRAFNTLLFLVRTTVEPREDLAPTDLPTLLRAELSRASESPSEGQAWPYEVTLAPEVPRVITADGPALKTLLAQLVGVIGDAGPAGVRIRAWLEEGALALELKGIGTGTSAVDAAHRDEMREMGLPLAVELARAVGGECRLVQGARLGEDLVIWLRVPAQV